MRNTPLRLATLISVATILAAFPLSAKESKADKAARPALFQSVINCRAIAESGARLACYDAQVARLDEAETKNELVVVDKKQVKEARKGLFGFSLPDLGLFGGKDAADNDPDQEGISKIESTVKMARQDGYGNWLVILEDGARWMQTDSKTITDPKPGQPIRIRKAALGSFFGNINNQTAVRMKRVN